MSAAAAPVAHPADGVEAERPEPVFYAGDGLHRGFITLAEACEVLGITIKTGYKLANEGRFPGAFQVGSRWRVAESEIGRLGLSDRRTA